ncbi:unnamed protein product [Cyclocybe aegerita]|uniref:Uncharacterized protein n=1 Tax=Cyclocybe aegerita TaxID=1973307 RepID=A0A8S0VU61_CYCAE|nr:unnamed protein product [Cyclocybe aegerita]
MSHMMQALTPYSPLPVVRQEQLDKVSYFFLKFYEYRFGAALTVLGGITLDEACLHWSCRLRHELTHVLTHIGRWTVLGCFPRFPPLVRALLQSIEVWTDAIYVLSPELRDAIPSYHVLMDRAISTLDWWNWDIDHRSPLPAELNNAFANYLGPNLVLHPSVGALHEEWAFPLASHAQPEGSMSDSDANSPTDTISLQDSNCRSSVCRERLTAIASALQDLRSALDDKAIFLDLRAEGTLRLSCAALAVSEKSNALGRLPEIADFGDEQWVKYWKGFLPSAAGSSQQPHRTKTARPTHHSRGPAGECKQCSHALAGNQRMQPQLVINAKTANALTLQPVTNTFHILMLRLVTNTFHILTLWQAINIHNALRLQPVTKAHNALTLWLESTKPQMLQSGNILLPLVGSIYVYES